MERRLLPVFLLGLAVGGVAAFGVVGYERALRDAAVDSLPAPEHSAAATAVVSPVRVEVPIIRESASDAVPRVVDGTAGTRVEAAPPEAVEEPAPPEPPPETAPPEPVEEPAPAEPVVEAPAPAPAPEPPPDPELLVPPEYRLTDGISEMGDDHNNQISEMEDDSRGNRISEMMNERDNKISEM